jgi:hypothetical protein
VATRRMLPRCAAIVLVAAVLAGAAPAQIEFTIERIALVLAP